MKKQPSSPLLAAGLSNGVNMEFIHGKRFDQFREDLDRETMGESRLTSWWWEEEGQRVDTELGEEEESKIDLLRRIPL